MNPKKKSQEEVHKRIKITVDIKREIIEKREQGMSVADLSRTYNRSTSTICTILKNKDKIKEIDASMGVTRISPQRLRILNDVERLLLLWINEKQLHGETINENIICEKAKVIFSDLVKKTPGSSMAREVFKGSRGWFEKFKRRTGIHSVLRHGEAASFVECDLEVLETVPVEPVVNEIDKIMGAEVDNNELVEEHNQELITEEPLDLHCVPQQKVVEKSLSEEQEEVIATQQSSGEIREMLKAWETVASFIEKHHPNKAVAMHATQIFNDNAVSHFQKILKYRQKDIP